MLGGLFGSLFSPDNGGVLSPDSQQNGGIGGNLPVPQQGMFGSMFSPHQKAALMFANIRDALKTYQGEDSDYSDQELNRINDVNQIGNQQKLLQSRNQALIDFSNAQTPADRQAAAVRLAAYGLGDFSSALKVGRPEYHYGRDGTVYSSTDGSMPQVVIPGKTPSGPKPPIGYTYSADGQSLVAIPGGPADPKTIKRNADQRRAPPKTPKGATFSLTPWEQQ